GFLMDGRRGECILFTDRYGVERLFLHADKTRLYFSSEAKAILAVAPAAREIDVVGLAEWLACGCTLGERSLFDGVEIMAAGTALRFTKGRAVERIRYFDRSTLEQLPAIPASGFVEQFTGNLRSSVNRAVSRPPSAALSLTGGLDSRLVIASLD